MRTFASQSKIKRFAQMAESVDALVSNTSGVTSIPVRPRVWVLRRSSFELLLFYSYAPVSTDQHKDTQTPNSAATSDTYQQKN